MNGENVYVEASRAARDDYYGYHGCADVLENAVEQSIRDGRVVEDGFKWLVSLEDDRLVATAVPLLAKTASGRRKVLVTRVQTPARYHATRR